VSFLEPVIAAFRARHHRVDLEIDVERRLVDVVADGYDAGVRLHEDIERDMIQVRLTDAFRWIVVGAPSYFARRGRPEHPDDLLRHDCINFRLATTGALYAWELARGRKTWRVPVPASIVSNDSALRVALATRGLGLAYAFEPSVRRLLADGQLEAALDAFAPTVPGFFLYYPRRARGSTLLRLFVDVARAVAPRGRVAAG
jgi:DNA-binding transcriptional LysR family regulator